MKFNTFFCVATAGIGMGASVANAAFVNELHYDNLGGDTGEFVEIVLGPGEVISDYSVDLYNGGDGAVYDTISTFTKGDTQNGFVIYSASRPGIQNGSPDGLALVSGSTVVTSGGVRQFLSYEGPITATGGPANGFTSTDIGVAEDGATPVGASLGLKGTGDSYDDFTFTTFTTNSQGAVNAGQTFLASTPVPEPLTVAGGMMLLGGVVLRRRRPVA